MKFFNEALYFIYMFVVMVIFYTISRASLHLAGQAKRPNPKLLSRGDDISQLKYTISVFLSVSKYFIEKKHYKKTIPM